MVKVVVMAELYVFSWASTLLEEFDKAVVVAPHPPPAIRAANAASTLLEFCERLLELVCVAAIVASVAVELFDRRTLDV